MSTPVYCPKKNRINILVITSVLLSVLLTTISVFNGQNYSSNASSSSTNPIFNYKNAEGKGVSKDLYVSGTIIDAIIVIYMLYICYIKLSGETWEFGMSGKNKVIYNYPSRGGTNIAQSFANSYERDVPCFQRKHKSTCAVGSRGCYWNEANESCHKAYSGGYGNFIIFLVCSLYLIAFGIIILRDQDETKTSSGYTNLAIGSVIVGCISLLFSIVDLVVC